MRLRMPLELLLCIMLLLLSACMHSATTSNPVYYYTLDYATPAGSFSRRLPDVLRVDHFSASPPFNTQRIIYADKGLHRNAYAHHRWIAPPAELLSYLLARDLQDSNAFQAVLAPDNSLPATHIIMVGLIISSKKIIL